MTKEKTYDDAGIAQKLADLPHWRHADGAIQRTFKTASWKGTLMVVTTIGHLCEVAWHHPDMVVGYDEVTVKLATHSAEGITDKDFALARKIEDVVGWQPGRDGGPFSGTPSDPKHAYIVHG